MFKLFHKNDASKKNMNKISYMCLSKKYIIKIIMNIKLVLTSKARHVEFLKRTMSIANHKDCNFENKISIPSGRAGSTRKRHGFVVVVVPLDAVHRCCSDDHARSPSARKKSYCIVARTGKS